MTVSPAAGVVDCAVVRREESLDKSPEAVVGEVLWRGNDLWCGQEIASDALKPVAREDQLVDVAVDCVGPIAEGSNIEVLVANGCKWKVRLLSDIISSLQMPEEKQQADKAKQRRGRGRPRKSVTTSKIADISLSDSDLLHHRTAILKEAEETVEFGKLLGYKTIGC
ncbi:hypothetical protein V6N13_096759 [Hibiscus sabdariffa]